MKFAIAIPRRVPALVEGGTATYVGADPDPSCTLEQKLEMPWRGQLVRELSRWPGGRWAGIITPQTRILWIFDAHELAPLVL